MGLAWLLSLTGYLWFFASRGRRTFAPLAAISVLGLGVFALSLCGWLAWGGYALAGVGLALLIWMLRCRDQALLHWDMALFALLCLALFLRYRNGLLVAYDDFSHWGMIVRRMLITNALPASGDSLIQFQSYPPGAACWLWYACRFLGGGDGMMLTAQAWLVLAALWPLTENGTGGGYPAKWVGIGTVLLGGLSLYQGTASLMVDNLLAALAIGALATALSDGKGKETCLSAALAMLCMVKDSGLFFAAVVFAALLLKKTFQSQKRLPCLGALVPVALCRAAWYVHIKTAFPAADISRHAFTLTNMKLAGADKSYADMLTIAKELLKRAATLNNQALQILLLVAITYGTLRLLGLTARRDGWVPLLGLAVYAAWLASLWGMYVFSMPVGGALNLDAYERYNSTCALFLYGAWAVWLLRRLRQGGRLQSVTALLLVLPMMWGGWRAGIPRLFRETYQVPMRVQMQALAEQRPVRDGEQAALLLPEGVSQAFAAYMARYVFQTAQMSVYIGGPVDDGTDVVYLLPGADRTGLPDHAQVVEER